MKLLKRKQRKALSRSVSKIIKKHGSEIAAGLASSVASTLATLASTDAPGTSGKKSNLRKLSQNVSRALASDNTKRSRHSAGSPKNADKKKRARAKKAAQQAKESDLAE